jgi:hypothetical protein
MRAIADPQLAQLTKLAKNRVQSDDVGQVYDAVQKGGVTPEKQAVVSALVHGAGAEQTERFVMASADPTATRKLLPNRQDELPARTAESLQHLLSIAANVLTGPLASAIKEKALGALSTLPEVKETPGVAAFGVRLPLSRDAGPGVQRFVHVDRDMGTFWVVEQQLAQRGRVWLPDPATTSWKGPGKLDIPSDVLWGSKPYAGS